MDGDFPPHELPPPGGGIQLQNRLLHCPWWSSFSPASYPTFSSENQQFVGSTPFLDGQSCPDTSYPTTATVPSFFSKSSDFPQVTATAQGPEPLLWLPIFSRTDGTGIQGHSGQGGSGYPDWSWHPGIEICCHWPLGLCLRVVPEGDFSLARGLYVEGWRLPGSVARGGGVDHLSCLTPASHPALWWDFPQALHKASMPYTAYAGSQAHPQITGQGLNPIPHESPGHPPHQPLSLPPTDSHQRAVPEGSAQRQGSGICLCHQVSAEV